MSVSFKPFVRVLPTPATIDASINGDLEESPTFLVHASAKDDVGVELLSDLNLKQVVASGTLEMKQGPESFFVGNWTTPWANWQELIKTNQRVYIRARLGDARTTPNRYNFLLTPYGRRALEKPFQDALAIRKSSSSLPRLTASGDKLLQNGKPFMLRGVNLSGLQHRDPFFVKDLGKEQRDWKRSTGFAKELIAKLKDEGVGIVRIPLSQQYVLDDVGLGPPKGKKGIAPYLETVDELIDWCTDNGIYVLLCLHTLASIRHKSPNDCYAKVEKRDRNLPDTDKDFGRLARVETEPFTPPMPDAMSPFFWSIMVQRYGNHSSVLFDLLNEPHVAGETDNTPVRKPARWDEGYFFPWIDRRSLDDRYYLLSSQPKLADRPVPASYDESFWTMEWHQWVRYFDILIRGSKDVTLGWGSPSRLSMPSERADETLLFVAGIHGDDWAASLSSMPVRTSQNAAGQLERVVYKSHVYQRTSEAKFNANLKLSKEIQAPIFIGEWGTWTTDSVNLPSDFPTKEKEKNKNYAECVRKGNLGNFDGVDDVNKFREWAKKVVSRIESRVPPQDPPKSSLTNPTHRDAINIVSGWTAWSVGDFPDILEKKDDGWVRSFAEFKKTENAGTWVFSALKFRIASIEVITTSSTKEVKEGEVYDVPKSGTFRIRSRVENGLSVATPTVPINLKVEDGFQAVVSVDPVSTIEDDKVIINVIANRATTEVVSGRDYCVLTLALDDSVRTAGLHKMNIFVRVK